MRYLVKALVKPGKEEPLLQAIEDGTLGSSSVAFGEYIRDMNHARQMEGGVVCWIEVCYCATPLEEEIPYWEEYFDLLQIKDAHDRRRCRDLNGEEWWACSSCDCTEKLEATIENWGPLFLDKLGHQVKISSQSNP
jgi:hypothetical protein